MIIDIVYITSQEAKDLSNKVLTHIKLGYNLQGDVVLTSTNANTCIKNFYVQCMTKEVLEK